MLDEPTPERRESGLLPIPLDDEGLDRIEAAMAGAFTVDEDGTHTLVGGDFTLTDLLMWYSEYDRDKLVLLDSSDMDFGFGPLGSAEVYEYTGVVYSEHDLIRALVDEVRRLRDL